MADDNLDIAVDGRTVSVSNPGKVLFPASGITKADLAQYYAAIAPVMVPIVGNRPITLVRHPSGIASKGFFQKNTPDHYPDWIPRVELKKRGGVVRHCVVDHGAALVYFSQQNVITPHIGLARADALDGPDLFAIDLDPSTDDFAPVLTVALATKELMERAGMVPFVQLTGSKGVHVVTPLAGSPTWDDARRFGHALATKLLSLFPNELTTEFAKVDRGNKIYLDMGRNSYQSTIAAPYGVRAFEDAPVVTPVSWEELGEPGTTARRYTIATVRQRLADRGDAWADMYASARPLPDSGATVESTA